MSNSHEKYKNSQFYVLTLIKNVLTPCVLITHHGVAIPGLFVKANAFKGARQRASLQKKEGKSQSTFYSLSTEVQVGWSVVFSTLAIFCQCY